MRIILYTGKGGVGKTSIAAATALKIADMGQKVLVMSTDQAHSLGDSLNKKLSGEPQSVADNLDAMEIDVVKESEKAYGKLKEYMGKLLTSKAEGGIEVEELLVLPGLEELCSLLKVKEMYDAGYYDTIVVDCAPTGETMSLLKFPEMFQVIMEKVMPIKRKAVKIAGPLVEKVTKIPMPQVAHMDEIEMLYNKLDKLRELMEDKEITSIRIVTTLEKIVMQEAKRSFSYLHLHDFNVDSIVVNRIYPQAAMSGYFQYWMKDQKASLENLLKSFAPIPIFKMPLLKHELRTIERLREAGEQLYGSMNPADILFEDTIFTLEPSESGYLLKIKLSFEGEQDMLDRSQLELLQNGSELTIAIQNERRSFILPDELKGKDIQGAKYDSGVLNIAF